MLRALFLAAVTALVAWVYSIGNKVVALETQRTSIEEHLVLIRSDIARVEQKVEKLAEKR